MRLVTIVKFGLLRAGSDRPVRALQRARLLVVRLVIADAFLAGAVEVRVGRTPASIAACTIASPSGERTGFATRSGPPTP